MVTFMVEDWFAVKDEMAALWPLHYEEVALNRDKIKLAPDFDMYAAYANSGMLHIVVGRKDGEIIGYHISVCRPHLHYRDSMSSFADVFFVKKEHRTGRTPLRLFETVEKTLRSRGVEKMFTGTKLSLNAGPLFEKMGWTPTEILYTKYIGD